MEHGPGIFTLGPSGFSAPSHNVPVGGSNMGTFETIAVVAAVYVLVFVAHQATRSTQATAPDET